MTTRFPEPLGFAVVSFAIILPGPQACADDTGAAAVIADQIRRQGYACEKPISAVRDRTKSKPNAAVWQLTCAGTVYRVVLVPDLAARVERIER